VARKIRVPAYLHHKGKDLAYVNFSGHVVYLGAYGSDESKRKYARLLAEWTASGGRPPGLAETVADLVATFWRWAKSRYVGRDGGPSREAALYKGLATMILDLYADVAVEAFGPVQLAAVREVMIGRGWTRKSINRQVGRVRRIFSWGVARGLVAEATAAALDRLEGLRPGERSVAEGRRVEALAETTIEAVRPLVSSTVWAMIDVQRLTGMRSGELVIMRPGDIDRGGDVWGYVPEHHKTEHHGRERFVAIGPIAQVVLRPFIVRRLAGDYLFSPAESMAEYFRRRAEARQTPAGYGNGPGTNRKRRPRNRPGDRFTPDSYRAAIASACDRAWPPPTYLARVDADRSIAAWEARLEAAGLLGDLKAWRRAHRWHPHQLRHTFTTRAGDLDIDLEATAAALGHASVDMTLLYRHVARQKAVAVAAAIG